MPPNHEKEFLRIVESDAWLMSLLKAVKTLELKHWAIAAGVVRSSVWDALHGFTPKTPCADVDVIFFDPECVDAAFERRQETRLAALMPAVHWEVVNQATVHSYTKEEPYRSLEHAMTRWAETATAVAVYLDGDDAVKYYAPHGLDDLMNMVVRPHLVTPDARNVYCDRIANKGWQRKWPKITILDP